VLRRQRYPADLYFGRALEGHTRINVERSLCDTAPYATGACHDGMSVAVPFFTGLVTSVTSVTNTLV
jgi:hypothetical protein